MKYLLTNTRMIICLKILFERLILDVAGSRITIERDSIVPAR